MLETELAGLELLLARSDDLLPLRRGKKRELIKQWERENDCFLPADLVEFYEWADGEEERWQHLSMREEMDFPLRHYSFVPFASAIQGGEHCFHLRELLVNCGIGVWNSIVRLVRPLWHHKEDHIDDYSSVDEHIFAVCSQVRARRSPLIVDGYEDDFNGSAYFLCDDVRAFVRCWCVYLENGRLLEGEWRAFNPFSSTWNNALFGRTELPDHFACLWRAPFAWETQANDENTL